jgi:uncharacterized protein YybS (DUF2232 family)
LGGNKYLNATLLNTTELISYIIGIPIVNKLKRKISFPGMFFITTLSSIVFFFSGDNSTPNLILGIINKVRYKIYD